MLNIFLFSLFSCFVCIASQVVCSAGSELDLTLTCVRCQPGMAKDPISDFEFCGDCISGTFQSLSGQRSCLPCPPGTESVFDSTMCGACLDGQTLFPNGTCTECPPGIEISSSDRTCVSCDDGFFKAEEGPGPCLPCPPGTVSVPGATTCGACLDRQIVFPNGTCGECPSGEMISAVSGSCLLCGTGFFKAEKGPGPCLRCPPGSFSSLGTTECVLCPESQAPVMADGSCKQCPPGSFFQDLSLSCWECPSGTFTNVSNLFSQCFPGDGNSFSLSGATECLICQENQAPVMPDGSCGQCPPGSQYVEYLFSCSECLAGSFSNVPNVFPRCFPCEGNLFASQGASECISCPIGQVFINSTQNYELGCDPGFVYREFELECVPCDVNQFTNGREMRCSSCSEGNFARVGSSTCLSCPSGRSFIEVIDGCGVCPEDEPYDFFNARCGFDSILLMTPPPEPRDEEELSYKHYCRN